MPLNRADRAFVQKSDAFLKCMGAKSAAPIDFFGDGPRTPFLVVSPFSRGGPVAHDYHVYYDHVSILKFIERNCKFKPLTARSRDNLPNPVSHEDKTQGPRNSSAIDFNRDGEDGRDEHRG